MTGTAAGPTGKDGGQGRPPHGGNVGRHGGRPYRVACVHLSSRASSARAFVQHEAMLRRIIPHALQQRPVLAGRPGFPTRAGNDSHIRPGGKGFAAYPISYVICIPVSFVGATYMPPGITPAFQHLDLRADTRVEPCCEQLVRAASGKTTS